jgi:hypothetical protein
MSQLNFNSETKRGHKKRAATALIAIGVISGVLSLGITFAARITLSNDGRAEFGQGFVTTTTCDTGGIKVTPVNSFYNQPGAGTFTFNSILVEEISTNCEGKDFIVKVYNQSGQAIEITNDQGTPFFEARVNFNPFTDLIQLSENGDTENGDASNTVSSSNGSWAKQFTLDETSRAIDVDTVSNLEFINGSDPVPSSGQASTYFTRNLTENGFLITFDPSGAFASGFTDSKDVYYISVESVDP